MRFAGRPSWRLSLDAPVDLHQVLFVRDAFGLVDHADAPTAAMPGHLLRVPDLSAEPEAPTPTRAGWEHWWQAALTAHKAASADRPSQDAPMGEHLRWARLRLAAVDDPDFATLVESPDLQRAAQLALEPFRRWWQSGAQRPHSTGAHALPGAKGELVDLIDPNPNPWTVNDTVARIEADLGRRVAPFDVTIEVLGVAGPDVLIQNEDYALISSALVDDQQRYATWLEAALRPLS